MINIEELKTPEDIKKLNFKELELLASEIRKFIIKNVSQTGGHLSANLGVVELTIALHYVFNSPHDKLIFDVGHQAYTHKILTGRSSQFGSLRQKDGLSGFLKYSESPHDVWEAGHAATSISAAAGFLEAKSKGEDIGEVIAIIGDGAIQNGLALSGLNYLGSKKNQKAIIILNDNEMSISKNVGSLSKIFNRIRIRKSYQLLKRITPKFVHRMFYEVKEGIKNFVYKNNFMNSLGFRYFGPINGHNLRTLIRYLEFAKKNNQSIIIHVKTIKGMGYPYAEKDQVGAWHGIGPFDIETGQPLSQNRPHRISWSQGVGDIILEQAQKNPRITVICPAMILGSGLDKFVQVLPKQIVDVGIAEEFSVVMGAAMARTNNIPVISIYSTFLQRAYDALNHDVARTNAHVVFLVDRAGIVGSDGDTHQGTFDVAFLSHLPNFTITMGRSLEETSQLIDLAINKHHGPFVIRYPRGDIRQDIPVITPVSYGKWEIVKPLSEINIISYGPVINKFASVIESENLQIGLINARFIKPLDQDVLKMLANKQVIIYEEVVLNGSLSSLIIESNTLNSYHLQVQAIAIHDQFVSSGSVKSLKKDLGLDIRDILKTHIKG
ncbi:MAG: 1-deoxy-D-xylulose-5-phosphate synthase [Bacilli bacterium]